MNELRDVVLKTLTDLTDAARYSAEVRLSAARELLYLYQTEEAERQAKEAAD